MLGRWNYARTLVGGSSLVISSPSTRIPPLQYWAGYPPRTRRPSHALIVRDFFLSFFLPTIKLAIMTIVIMVYFWILMLLQLLSHHTQMYMVLSFPQFLHSLICGLLGIHCLVSIRTNWMEPTLWMHQEHFQFHKQWVNHLISKSGESWRLWTFIDCNLCISSGVYYFTILHGPFIVI